MIGFSKYESIAYSVGLRKDWDEYLLKRLGQATSTPPSLVVIEEIVETPTDPRSSGSRKGQALSAIGGFIPLVLALLAVTGLVSSSVQEGTAIVLAIRGFDSLILPKPASRISGVSSKKALEAILPSPVVK